MRRIRGMRPRWRVWDWCARGRDSTRRPPRRIARHWRSKAKLPGVELDLGLAEFKQGHLKGAIAPFQAALREQPKSLQARTLLGMTYYGTAQYAEAIPYLRVAAEKSPDNEEMLGVLAQSCLYAKQYECTLEEYKKILTVNPNSAQAHMLAGEAWDGMYEPEKATAEFEAAEKVAPNEPNVHFGLGYLYWKQHRYADAEREFETGTEKRARL